ncbi:MAG: hypothetical protein V2I37_11955 [Marinilabiliaceae bacterium]|jgi:hypothetical protein|nr:hypothetical protein [Marinilabiliaceae bacterium]
MKNSIPALLVLLMLFLSSCGGGGKKNSNFVFPEADSLPMAEVENLSDEAIEDIVQNISSPVEVAALLQSLQVPYFGDMLASTEAAKGLSTSFEQALRLGIYGADLGYLNIYEKTGTSIENLTTINELADGIRVGQFFDFETLKRLAINKNNLDSLLFMSVDSYNRIDDYLRENNRGYLSALMITGVWLEAQYLICKVVKDYPHEEIRNRIGEQKIVLNDLMLLLSPYKESSEEYANLYKDFERIKDVYRDVEITFTPGEPETVEEDGRLVVVQVEESVVTMTDSQLEDIIILIDEIRNKLTSN